MLIQLLATTALLVPAATPVRTAPPTVQPCAEGHGKLNWFAGSYEEALVKAKSENKIVFMDFWTEWCGWCKKLDGEAFSADSVVAEMSDIICLSIDAESETGSVIAQKYGVRGYPTLLFLDADSAPRDVIGGYMPTDKFLATVRRIESGEGTIGTLREASAKDPNNLQITFQLLGKLTKFNARADMEAVTQALTEKIKAGQGFDPSNIDSVFGLYKDLMKANLKELAEEQALTMKRLDPEGKSLGMRRMQFEGLAKGLKGTEDLVELKAFLKDETYDELLFDGWNAIYQVTDRASKREKKDETRRLALRQETRVAAATLWKHTPVERQAMVGNSIAWGFYEDAEHLTDSEKSFALSIAEVAVKADNTNPNVVDTYACCLFINGKIKEAVMQIERCIELDPKNEEWSKRKAMFLENQG